MKALFLNDTYQDYFSSHVRVADKQWYQWLDEATQLIDKEDFLRGKLYLGYCFDLSMILIDRDSQYAQSKFNHFEKLTLSGHGLAQCLLRLKDDYLVQYFLIETHLLLNKMVRSKPHLNKQLKSNIELSNYMLHRFFGSKNPIVQ